jgi:hypothetical protein
MNKTSLLTVAGLTAVVLIAVFFLVPLAQELFRQEGPKGPHPSVGITTDADRERQSRERDEVVGREPDPEPALEVVVSDAEDGSRVERGCSIQLSANGAAVFERGHSDGQAIRLMELPAGEVLRVEAARMGYETLVQPYTVLPPAGQPLRLKLYRRTEVRLVAEAAPGCVVAPRVLFFRSEIPDVERGESNWMWAERTAGLPSRGTWHVFVPEIPQVDFENAGRNISPWLTPRGEVFRWPGTVHSLQAAGKLLDMKLKPAEMPATGCIRGELRSADGTPEAHRRVYAVRATGPLRVVQAAAETDEQGRYRLGPVPDGTYLVLFDAPVALQSELVATEVKGADVTVPAQVRPAAFAFGDSAAPGKITLNLASIGGAASYVRVELKGLFSGYSDQEYLPCRLEILDVPPGWYVLSLFVSAIHPDAVLEPRRVHLAPGESLVIEEIVKLREGAPYSPTRILSVERNAASRVQAAIWRIRPRVPKRTSQSFAQDRPIGNVRLKLPKPVESSKDESVAKVAARMHRQDFLDSGFLRDFLGEWRTARQVKRTASIEVKNHELAHEHLWSAIVKVRCPQDTRGLGIEVVHTEPSTFKFSGAHIKLRRTESLVFIDCYDLPDGCEFELVTVPGHEPVKPVNGVITLKPLK